MNKFLKIAGILFLVAILLLSIPVALYLFVLPNVVSNSKFLDYVKENVKPNKDTVYFVSTDDEESTNSVMAQLSINNYAIIKIEPTVEDNSDEYNYDEDNYDEDNYNEDYQE